MNPNIDNIRLGISNPSLLGRKLSQIYNYFRTGFDYNPSGINVMEQDWDNLVILDACRYDAFEQENRISGRLKSVKSRASATPEFLRGNFRDSDFFDTVYVTTNPMLHRYSDRINVNFHDIHNLWMGDTWDTEYQTVLPEVVTKETKKVSDRMKNKRMIIHFMQPHYPFIESDTKFDKGHIGTDSPDELTTWMQIMTGRVKIDKQTLWEAYTANLRRALPHVQDLVEFLPGKTVITSDHGNMFGEKSSPIPIREWGHPPGIWTEELLKVPWFEVEPVKERKNIISERPSSERSLADDSVVAERLKSLGYSE